MKGLYKGSLYRVFYVSVCVISVEVNEELQPRKIKN